MRSTTRSRVRSDSTTSAARRPPAAGPSAPPSHTDPAAPAPAALTSAVCGQVARQRPLDRPAHTGMAQHRRQIIAKGRSRGGIGSTDRPVAGQNDNRVGQPLQDQRIGAAVLLLQRGPAGKAAGQPFDLPPEPVHHEPGVRPRPPAGRRPTPRASSLGSADPGRGSRPARRRRLPVMTDHHARPAPARIAAHCSAARIRPEP